MNKIEDAKKKLEFASFLMTNNKELTAGVIKNILLAAQLAVLEWTSIDEKMIASPRFVQQALGKFDEAEVVEFKEIYSRLVDLSYLEMPSEEDCKRAMAGVKKFVDWVQAEREVC